MRQEIRVRLFVPNPIAAEVCAEVLQASPGVRLVDERHPFDVAIFDSASFNCLPDLIREKEWQGVKILVLACAESASECMQWLRQGARAVVEHAKCRAELASAVKHVSEGHYCVPDAILRRVLTEGESRDSRAVPGLTHAEAEVARLVSAGFTNKRAAESLNISVNTVKTHLYHIYQKAGVHNRAEFIALWGFGRKAGPASLLARAAAACA